MIALYILGGIVLIFAFLLTRKLHICIGYDKNVFFEARYLFFRYSLKLEKGKGEQKKIVRDRSKKPAKAKKKKEKTEPDGKKTSPPVKELLGEVLDVLKTLLHWLGNKVYVEKLDIRVCIATDDAAKTAILYGAVSPLVAQITAIALKMPHRRSHEKLISTRCDVDFIGEDIDFLADTAFAFRLTGLFPIIFKALGALLKYLKLKNSSSSVPAADEK